MRVIISAFGFLNCEAHFKSEQLVRGDTVEE